MSLSITIQKNSTFSINWHDITGDYGEPLYAECRYSGFDVFYCYAECGYYAERLYAECCGAVLNGC